MMSSLFQSMEFRINDKTVSRISDFCAQVDALHTRVTKSSSWIDTVGEVSNWWATDQKVRQAQASSDGEIIAGVVPVVNAIGTETARGDPGFYAAPTGAANAQIAAYDASNGQVTFSRAGTAPALPDATLVWKVGDFFAYRGTGLDGVNNVQMKVISVDSATQITVEAIVQNSIDATPDPALDFYKVSASVVTNASPSRRAGEFELIWKPPLSIFQIDHALPSCRAELILNPQTATSFQQRGIESLLGSASKTPTLPGSAPGDFKLAVVDMYMYAQTVEGPRADDITYLLDLHQIRAQSEKIDSASFQQKNFDVSPSTTHLTVAYQDLRAGNNTALSVSKFKSYEAGLTPSVSQELGLNRFFINYAGQNFPAPDADPSFVAGTDYTVQRYSETQLYSGAWYDTGGAETIEQWHDRGAYYHFAISRDGTDRSTRVNVHQQFEQTTDVGEMRVLLFDHSKQVARIRVEMGRVVDVQIEDA